MVQMKTRTSVHVAGFSSPSSPYLGELLCLPLFSLRFSVCLTPPPVHVPSFFPLGTLLVAISVARKRKKATGETINLWFSPQRWVVVAEGSKPAEENLHKPSMTSWFVSVGCIEPHAVIFHQNPGFTGETETGLGKYYTTINTVLVSNTLWRGTACEKWIFTMWVASLLKLTLNCLRS